MTSTTFRRGETNIIALRFAPNRLASSSVCPRYFPRPARLHAFLLMGAVTIASAATGVADSIPIASGPSARWMLTITDNITGDQTLSEIWAGNDGTLVAHTRYGINSIGTPVPHTVDVFIVGGSMELQVTNTGGNTVTSRAVRILTSA